MAVGYRFEAAGRWGEPWETLDADPEYRPVSLDARAPRIDTAFKTADGRDCGKYEVEFAEAAAVSPAPPLHYLVDNSNISGLLSTITACAAAGSVHR
jgi:hypothetical protein